MGEIYAASGRRGFRILFGIIAAFFVFSNTPFDSMHSVQAAVSPLKVSGTGLVDENGTAIQLRGVSTHGLSWYPEYVNRAAFRSLKKWGCNTVRLAMYTAEYNGYCTGGKENQRKLKALIRKGISYAQDLDMYIIIDWHVLSDGNPDIYKKQSAAFFKEMARQYRNCPNVIFEICNEPNGGTGWKTVKKYAESIIRIIRAQGSNAVVIVGTPTWSQEVNKAAENPITKYGNIVYAFHFYAGTHQKTYRNKLVQAVKGGLPVLVSEFGICDASGSGHVNTKQANEWMKILKKYKIGYVMWNLSNKNETSALLKSSCRKISGWKNADLSSSGKWLVKALSGKK